MRKDSIVEVRKWSNTDPLATVLRLPLGADNRNVTVPKKYLRPEEPAVAGLIQQTMLNRFDPSIRKWVDHYNAKLGYTGDRALDPNLVEAMLFQESQMGTEAKPLQVTTTHPDVTTQLNVPPRGEYRDEVTGRLAAAQAARAKSKRFLADKIER
ncbi:MAG TPA: hypothetical protein VEX67_12380 [Solirubrobacteraceae bacterium]|nr:hypothetical protein [Solirubrobacteraceae bacterium]